MHTPKPFEVTDPEAIKSLIANYPLATWVNSGKRGLVINHVPFIYHSDALGQAVLRGHIAKANPVWKSINDGCLTAAVFQGPQSYISPSWYVSKLDHGKVVPTWNYMVVHVHGTQRVITDKEWLIEQVGSLTDKQEEQQAQPWKVTDAPERYTQKLLNAIVGIEIVITRTEATWKMSQNRSIQDQQGVISALEQTGTDQAKEMAKAIKSSNSKK